MALRSLSDKLKNILKKEQYSVNLISNNNSIIFKFDDKKINNNWCVLKQKNTVLDKKISDNESIFEIDDILDSFSNGNIEIFIKNSDDELLPITFHKQNDSFNCISFDKCQLIKSQNTGNYLSFKLENVTAKYNIKNIQFTDDNIIFEGIFKFKQKFDENLQSRLKSNFFIEIKHRHSGKFINKAIDDEISVSTDELLSIGDSEYFDLYLKFKSNSKVNKKRIVYSSENQFKSFSSDKQKIISSYRTKFNKLSLFVSYEDIYCSLDDLKVNESLLEITGKVNIINRKIADIDKAVLLFKKRGEFEYKQIDVKVSENYSFNANLNISNLLGEDCIGSKYDFFIRIYYDDIYYDSKINLSNFKNFYKGEDRFLESFTKDDILYTYYATLNEFMFSLWVTTPESFRKSLNFTKGRTIFNENLNKKMDKNLVVFESFFGKAYSGNPKYIYETMLEMGLDKKYKFVWVYSGENKDIIPGNPIIVDRYEPGDYYKYLGLAKYWVNNIIFPVHKKRSKGVYLQTWHGTPLKKLGFDITIDGPEVDARNNFYKESRNWDYLISSNPYSSNIFKRAFKFNKEILELGYPANDIFFKDNDEFTDNLKSKLGIPKDKKIIIYAPTWRDDQQVESWKHYFKLDIDLEQLHAEISDEYVLLLKMHHLVSENLVIDEKFNDFVFDLSGYDDIQELYILSDMLITDYSSVFFDYAHLKRPILFFAPDLEHYLTNVRGLYLDMESELPGPIIKDNDELIDNIKNIDEVNEKYLQNYEEFYERFCSLCKGDSAKKIIEEVFEVN